MMQRVKPVRYFVIRLLGIALEPVLSVLACREVVHPTHALRVLLPAFRPRAPSPARGEARLPGRRCGALGRRQQGLRWLRQLHTLGIVHVQKYNLRTTLQRSYFTLRRFLVTRLPVGSGLYSAGMGRTISGRLPADAWQKGHADIPCVVRLVDPSLGVHGVNIDSA